MTAAEAGAMVMASKAKKPAQADTLGANEKSLMGEMRS